MQLQHPYMIVMSGPNGAGKTTFYSQIISQNPFLAGATFLNYDNEIAALKHTPEYAAKYTQIIRTADLRIIKKTEPYKNMFTIPMQYDTTPIRNIAKQLGGLNTSITRQATANMRQKIQTAFDNMDNIIFETTTSATRMKKLAADHGYDIYGFHICVLEPELSVARVQQRVKKGGHDIPEKIIYQRYKENIATLSNAMCTEHSAIILDNSNKKPFNPVFALSDGHIIDITDCPEYLQQTRAKLLQKFPQKSFKEILNLDQDINIKALPSDQRKTLTQMILLNLLGKMAWQK